MDGSIVAFLIVAGIWMFIGSMIKNAKKQQTQREKQQQSGYEQAPPPVSPLFPFPVSPPPAPAPQPKRPAQAVPAPVRPKMTAAPKPEQAPPRPIGFLPIFDADSAARGILYAEILGKPKALRGR